MAFFHEARAELWDLAQATWQGVQLGGALPPKGAACSSRRLSVLSPGAGARPGKAQSRCPAVSSALHRCHRPGPARCWCTGTPPGVGPATTQAAPAGVQRPRHYWCPQAGAASVVARAWGTPRCGCPRTCRNLWVTPGKEGRESVSRVFRRRWGQSSGKLSKLPQVNHLLGRGGGGGDTRRAPTPQGVGKELESHSQNLHHSDVTAGIHTRLWR